MCHTSKFLGRHNTIIPSFQFNPHSSPQSPSNHFSPTPLLTLPTLLGPKSTSTIGGQRTSRYCGIPILCRGRQEFRVRFGRGRCGWLPESVNQSWTATTCRCIGGAWKAVTQSGIRRKKRTRPSWKTNAIIGNFSSFLFHSQDGFGQAMCSYELSTSSLGYRRCQRKRQSLQLTLPSTFPSPPPPTPFPC